MPLTIKELAIRVRVGGGDEEAPPVQRAPSGEGTCEAVDHQKVVDDSVRRVLEALRDLEER